MSNSIRFERVILVIVVIASAGIISSMRGANSEKEQGSVTARLRELEDKEEIRRLQLDYGRFLDQRKLVAFSQLFADPEGEWIGGMGRAKGPQAIQELMEKSIGNKTDQSNFHLFTNQIIDINGDKATADAKWIFVIRGEANRPQIVYLGHDEDSFVRERGKWKFLRRVVHSDIPADKPSVQ